MIITAQQNNTIGFHKISKSQFCSSCLSCWFIQAFSEIVSQIKGSSEMGFSKIGFPARHIMGIWLVSFNFNPSSADDRHIWDVIAQQASYTLLSVPLGFIVGTLGCVFIDNETHESGVTKCTTGEAWSAFSWHLSRVFHCKWTHNQVFLLLSHMLI